MLLLIKILLLILLLIMFLLLLLLLLLLLRIWLWLRLRLWLWLWLRLWLRHEDAAISDPGGREGAPVPVAEGAARPPQQYRYTSAAADGCHVVQLPIGRDLRGLPRSSSQP